MINLDTIQNANIRRQFDENAGLWYFSVVDVVAVASGSSDPRNYWKVLKNRLKKSQNELVTACNQLKMESVDGKMYLTDVATAETLIHIVEGIAKPAVAPFRLWFARVASAEGEDETAVHADTEMKLMVDGYETEHDIIVQAMVGGTKLEDLSISVEHKTLTIRGKVSALGVVSDENKIIKEISWGSFSRVLPLPALVDIDGVEARIESGLLEIKLPKINISRTKVVRVKAA